MFAAERQARIFEEVEQRGAVRVVELAELLGVSAMTIRRDLDTLAADQRLDKVHGGATAKRAPSTEEPGFEAKRSLQMDEKRNIAAAAASLIRPGSAVGISAGTTTWTMAQHLRGVPDLTVVTNSMRIADQLSAPNLIDSPNVILTGGIRTPSDALVGPVAVNSLQMLHLDMVFLGVHGMDESAGFTTPNLLEADTDRALVAAAKRLVVVADHTKWATVGISTIAPLDGADVVISDPGLPEDARTCLRNHVGELLLVDGS